MSSAQVDYGPGFSIPPAQAPLVIPQEPTPDSPGARGETRFDLDIPKIKMDIPREPASVDNDSLFKLSGVDFVREGGFAFGRTERGSWKPGAEALPLLAEGPDKSGRGRVDDRPENETGDGLQQGHEHQPPPPPPTAEKMEVNETDLDKPLVRKQFKNFRLNEKILGQIASERASLKVKEEGVEEPSPAAPPHRTNHLLFNGPSAGRLYTLTFSRDENSERLHEAKSDAFNPNRFRHVNCYALSTTPIAIPSIYDDTDVDMPLSQLPAIAQFRNIVAEDMKTHSVSRMPEDMPGNLKIYKTHSNLTVDLPLKSHLPGIANACEDSSCNTLDTDIQVEDEIKTVEPLSSVSSADHAMTSSAPASLGSIGGMDLEPTAVIVIGDLNPSAGMKWGSLEMDEQMPSEISLRAGAMTRDRRKELYSSGAPDRRRFSRKLDSRGDENWKGRRSAAEVDGTLDSWEDDESVTLDISRKNSFVSIDLDSESFSRDSEDAHRIGSARGPETMKGLKGFPDSKRNQSRLLKMKRKFRNICEKVKHNVIKKK